MLSVVGLVGLRVALVTSGGVFTTVALSLPPVPDS